MSTAVFEELKADKTGVLRVYETEDNIEPAPYKFFMSISINGDNAVVKGLNNCNINMHDFSAICSELKRIGIKMLSWKHHGKFHSVIIK